MIDGITTVYTLMQDRELYEHHADSITYTQLPAVYEKVVRTLGEWYKAHPASRQCPADDLEVWFFHRGGGKRLALPEAQMVRAMFDKIRNNVTPLPSSDMIMAWKEAKVFARMQDVINGRKPHGTLAEFLIESAEYITDPLVTGAAQSYGLSMPSMMVGTANGVGCEWKLDAFNMSLGPIRRGDFIVLGARPELGKTSFTMWTAIEWMKQYKMKTLVVNNEEARHRLFHRALQITNVKNAQWVQANMPKALADAEAVGVSEDTFRIIDVHSKGMEQIDAEVARFDPDIVIINQLHKIRVKDSRLNSADRMEQLGMWARNMAVEGRIVFGIVQADVTAHLKRKVYDSQLYGSKTAIQGEADAIICLGGEGPSDDIRAFHITKNKLLGGPQTVASAQYAYIELGFNKETGHFA